MFSPIWTRGEDTWEQEWDNNDGSTTTEVVTDDGSTYEIWEDSKGNEYIKEEGGEWEQA